MLASATTNCRCCGRSWSFSAPVALSTAALDGPLGAVRLDQRYQGCQREALAVARAVGARIDEDALRALQQAAPARCEAQCKEM